MKIRTEDEFQDALDKETSWRKKELSAIKSNISSARNSAKNTALRAGITLLYAHWEGLVKNVASYYLSYVSFQRCKYGELKSNFIAIAMKKDLKQFDASNKSTIHNRIVDDIMNIENKQSKIPYENIIKTNSNLKSDIFVEIMETIGLDYSQYEANFVLLDETLLRMRNEIAHGERIEALALDEKRFDEIYTIMLSMMNKFTAQVTNAVVLKSYLKIKRD